MSLKGGAKKPELAKLLCENSGTDVEWLVDKFNLDLSLVACVCVSAMCLCVSVACLCKGVVVVCV